MSAYVNPNLLVSFRTPVWYRHDERKAASSPLFSIGFAPGKKANSATQLPTHTPAFATFNGSRKFRYVLRFCNAGFPDLHTFPAGSCTVAVARWRGAVRYEAYRIMKRNWHSGCMGGSCCR